MTQKNVEAIYPLAPMQAGMLFHTLLQPASGVYVEQYHCTLAGTLDAPAMQMAWQAALDRHGALRTLFNWKVREEPLQIVLREAVLPWAELDWRADPPDGQAARLAAHLAEDRRRGFDMGQAPLMRVTLIRLDAARTRLVWTFHHAVLDGWSAPLVLQEVFTRYAGQVSAEEIVHQPVRPYKEYINWLQQQETAAGETFWRQQLGGLDASPAVEVGEDAPLASPGEMGRLEQHLPVALTAALQEMARRRRLTLSTIVQGAWALLLAHYTDRQEVVFGVTVAGRPPEVPDVEQMIGLFINTLPVRVPVTSGAPLHTWLAALQAAQVEARRHGHVGLVQLQQWSSLPKGTPLFDTLVLFENQPRSAAGARRALEAAGLQLGDEGVVEQTNFPLTLVSGPGERLPLILHYDSSRYSAATVARMLGHLAALLAGFAAAPEAPLRELSLFTTAEHEQLLRIGQGPRRDYGPARTVHGLFLEQARRAPGATALLESGRSVTYAELAQRAAGVAAALAAAGVSPGAIVALCAERSSVMVAGLLGILLRGAAYLPLDPAYPAARLAFMLDDSRAEFLLTERSLAGRLPAFSGQRLFLEEIATQGAAASASVPPIEEADLDGDAPAYVIYTSGSTGQPKGVVGLHRGAVNRMQWMWESFPFRPGDVCVQKTALSFVDSVWEIFGPLLAGVPSLLLPPAEVQDVRTLVRALHAGRVTRIVLVPSLLRVLLDLYADLAHHLPELTLWICSGEALPADLARRFLRQMPQARLLNVYGSSEVSADVTWFDVANLAADAPRVPIGRPLPNTEVYVLNSFGVPAPPCVAGMLYVGGAHLAAGYLHRPDLTAERFVTVDVQGHGAVRLFATGDRARWLPSGDLEYLGRRDDQVKVRGMRIELAEVRSVLAAHPAVAEAEVAIHEVDGVATLAAYVVAHANMAVDVAGLRTRAAEQLPAHMAPAAYTVLQGMPLTPNGKIDRQRLPPPTAYAYAGPDPGTGARSEVEARLVDLWEKLLRRGPISVHSNFFEVGGHSLLAMHLFVLIEKEFGVSLPLASLLRAPTIAGLAQLIDAQASPSAWRAVVPVQPLGSRPPLYCVHGITGDILWFRDLGRNLAPDQPLFGLQAPALDGTQAPFDDLSAMAASYVAEIRAHRPRGPYFLGGASFGGTVALEMAQQLTAQGEHVALLVQFDHAPFVAEERSGWTVGMAKAARMARNAPRWLASMQEMGAERAAARTRRKLHNVWEKMAQIGHLSAAAPVQSANLIDYADQLPVHRRQLIESHYRAIATYRPQPYAGKVLLLRAQTQPLFSTIDPVARWRRLVGDRLAVHSVPGSHEGIFHEPHVQHLASQLRAALAQG